MNELIKGVKFQETGYGAIFDHSGLAIAHGQRMDLAGKIRLNQKQIDPGLKLGAAELDERLISLFKTANETGKQVRGTYVFDTQVPNMAVLTPVNLPGEQRWVVMVSAPEAETTREVTALNKLMLEVALVCLAIAAMLVFYFSRRFTQPMIKLRDEALFLAEGNLQRRQIDIRSRDEIGQLANAFAQTGEKLRNLVQKVQSKAEDSRCFQRRIDGKRPTIFGGR